MDKTICIVNAALNAVLLVRDKSGSDTKCVAQNRHCLRKNTPKERLTGNFLSDIVWQGKCLTRSVFQHTIYKSDLS